MLAGSIHDAAEPTVAKARQIVRIVSVVRVRQPPLRRPVFTALPRIEICKIAQYSY
jgi:hypothetical protein